MALVCIRDWDFTEGFVRAFDWFLFSLFLAKFFKRLKLTTKKSLIELTFAEEQKKHTQIVWCNSKISIKHKSTDKSKKTKVLCIFLYDLLSSVPDKKLKSYLHNGTDKSLSERSNREKIQLSKCLNSYYVLHARFVLLLVAAKAFNSFSSLHHTRNNSTPENVWKFQMDKRCDNDLKRNDNDDSNLKLISLECGPKGLGVRLSKSSWDPYPFISHVEDDSTAQQRELQVGDCILKVHKKVSHMSTACVNNKTHKTVVKRYENPGKLMKYFELNFQG